MKQIAGIDPGSFVIATAVCDEDGMLLRTFLAEPPKQRVNLALSRLCPLITEFRKHLSPERLDFCYIEEPIYCGSFKATVAMGMVAGAIVVALEDVGIPYSFVGNSVWKKSLIGRGNATKDEIKAWVIARFGVDSDMRQDIYDAIAIAEWGRRNFAKD